MLLKSLLGLILETDWKEEKLSSMTIFLKHCCLFSLVSRVTWNKQDIWEGFQSYLFKEKKEIFRIQVQSVIHEGETSIINHCWS